MVLRGFRPADLPTLYKIDRACFPPGVSYSTRELQRFISFSKSRTWVAEKANQIVGFLILGREPRRVGHVITIDVVESERRSGVGTALMDATEAWASREKLRLIYLETADDNRAAQIFYTARGYVKVDEVPKYYSNGQTAWVMVKWLK